MQVRHMDRVEALQEALRHVSQPRSVTVVEAVDALGGPGKGGGVAAVAKIAGVTSRTVQRWRVQELGELSTAKQRRKPTQAHRVTLNEQIPIREALKKLSKNGGDITTRVYVRVSPHGRNGDSHARPKNIAVPMGPEYFENIEADINRRDWEQAADDFWGPALDIYGIDTTSYRDVEDVLSLDIRPM